MISTPCLMRLRQAQGYHIQLANGFFNHLNMALIALDKMQASETQQQQFFDHYAKLFKPIDQLPSTQSDTETDLPIDRYFYQQLNDRGLKSVLSEVLPELLPRISALAFHGLIKLAYGILADDKIEIAQSLACWQQNDEPPLQMIDTGRESMDSTLIALSQFEKLIPKPGGLITQRLLQIRESGIIENHPQAKLFNRLPIDLNQQTLARTILAFFRHSQDFTMLHTLTGFHALRIVLDIVPQYQDDAIAYYWQAVIAAWLSTPLKPWNATPTRYQIAHHDAIAALQTIARQSKNDHHVKLVYSCLSEYDHYDHEDYLWAAAANLRLTRAPWQIV